jgi:hypothetical protein
MAIDIEAWTSDAFLTIRPLTMRAEAWVSDNIEWEAIWVGDTFVCEHRYGLDLLLGAHQDGLTVSLDEANS